MAFRDNEQVATRNRVKWTRMGKKKEEKEKKEMVNPYDVNAKPLIIILYIKNTY